MSDKIPKAFGRNIRWKSIYKRFHVWRGNLPNHLKAGSGAALAGLWHDLGKYTADFQDYLMLASGYEKQDAHVE